MTKSSLFAPNRGLGCLRTAGPLAVALAVLVSLAASAPAVSSDSRAPASPAGADPEGLEASRSTPVQVSVDIRPGLCPNHIRADSRLAVPIAILSTVDFEADGVDPSSVRLFCEGNEAAVEPTGWTYEDVGTPVVGGLCACHKLRGDGLDDLEFFFSIEDMAAVLDLHSRVGEIVPLIIRGKLTTGETVEGLDCAMVIRGPWGTEEFGSEVGLLTEGGMDDGGETPPGRFRFTYFTTVSERVTFGIYDVKGRMVARLNDMDMAPGIYNATWNGRDENREKAPAGIYFARVNNSTASATMKITVPD